MESRHYPARVGHGMHSAGFLGKSVRDRFMQEEIANLVYPIFMHGLHLKQRLDRGDALLLDDEQAKLKGLLLTETEARRWPDFGGTAEPQPSNQSQYVAMHDERGMEDFLGIRYALVCWLDELFILESPWSSAWNERKLEAALYGTNDRAWKFWEQAQLAEKRSTRDTLEAFFLCVLLGFRGDYAEDRTKLENWVAAARAHIHRGLTQDWPYPPELEPPMHVPPRRGRDRLRTMLSQAGFLILVLIPFLVVFLMQQLDQ